MVCVFFFFCFLIIHRYSVIFFFYHACNYHFLRCTRNTRVNSAPFFSPFFDDTSCPISPSQRRKKKKGRKMRTKGPGGTELFCCCLRGLLRSRSGERTTYLRDPESSSVAVGFRVAVSGGGYRFSRFVVNKNRRRTPVGRPAVTYGPGFSQKRGSENFLGGVRDTKLWRHFGFAITHVLGHYEGTEDIQRLKIVYTVINF